MRQLARKAGISLDRQPLSLPRSVDHANAHRLVYLALRVAEELRQDLSGVRANE
jgi:hypothetical protein